MLKQVNFQNHVSNFKISLVITGNYKLLLPIPFPQVSDDGNIAFSCVVFVHLSPLLCFSLSGIADLIAA